MVQWVIKAPMLVLLPVSLVVLVEAVLTLQWGMACLPWPLVVLEGYLGAFNSQAPMPWLLASLVVMVVVALTPEGVVACLLWLLVGIMEACMVAVLAHWVIQVPMLPLRLASLVVLVVAALTPEGVVACLLWLLVECMVAV